MAFGRTKQGGHTQVLTPTSAPSSEADLAVEARPAVLEGVGLAKVYGSGDGATRALDGCDVRLQRGEILAVVGPSGSGKSTLMHLLAGLDVPSSGAVSLNGQDLYAMSDAEAARFRAEHIGFVLQRANLIPSLTVRENVAAPMILSGVSRAQALGRADEMLDRVGVGRRARAFPAQVSGGEAQRAAVARACAGRPVVVFADEPTGAVDQAASATVMDLFGELVRELGTSAVIVTHDDAVARCGDTVMRMLDGKSV